MTSYIPKNYTICKFIFLHINQPLNFILKIHFESKIFSGRKFAYFYEKQFLDCYVRSFQYKVLNNVLYFNKKLFIFGKSSSPLRSFRKNADETILHLFYECNINKELRKSLISFFDKCLNLPYLTSQTPFLRFINTYCNDNYLKTTFYQFSKLKKTWK